MGWRQYRAGCFAGRLGLASLLLASFSGVAAVGTASAAQIRNVTPSLRAAVVTSSNLLANPGAEAGPGAIDSSGVIPPPDWTTTGQFTAIKYGASGGFPTLANSTSISGGTNFFAGGNVALSTATQTVSVLGYKTAIATGNQFVALRADLGGFANQNDNAVVTATFLNVAAKALGSLTTGPVTEAERGGQTELLPKSATTKIPVGTVSIRVTITSTRTDGAYDDGYADNLSLTLTPTASCPGAADHILGSATGIASVSIGGCPGYFVVDAAGKVAAFGSATWHGDASSGALNAPILAISATPDGLGYWLLGADGGIFTYGDAHFYGSTGSMRLNAPVVGMAVTPDSKGYWIIAKDGGVFSFGDAVFHGSTGSIHLNAPVDGIAVAPGGDGYWLVASDGGVFTFTTDGFYGSHGGSPLNQPVVGMSSTPDGKGYTLVASDGGVFSYGDAPFYGSLGSTPPSTPILDLSPAPADNGYYLVDGGGGVYAFGPGATYLGNA